MAHALLDPVCQRCLGGGVVKTKIIAEIFAKESRTGVVGDAEAMDEIVRFGGVAALTAAARQLGVEVQQVLGCEVQIEFTFRRNFIAGGASRGDSV